MKRTLRVLLCLCIILGLCACGQKETAPTWKEQYDLGIRYLSEGNYEEALADVDSLIQLLEKSEDEKAAASVKQLNEMKDSIRERMNSFE